MGYVVKHTTTGVNNARRKGNVALGVDADGYDKTSVSGFYAGVAPVPGFHNLVRTSASDDPDFYTLTDLELVNFANSLGGSVTDVTGAKVYLASRNDVMFTDDIPDDTEVDGLILELDASKLSSYPESGNTWYDLSGNGNNGTLTNGPTFNSNGYLEFDGGDDYVLGIGSLGISGNASLSISYFARWDGSTFSGNYPSGVGNNSTGTGNRGLSTTWKDGRIALDFWNNRFRANTALSVQKWYHVAFTKSPGLIGSTSKLYVNGQEVPGSTEGTNTTPNITDSSWVVGRLDSSRWFDGQVSQVQIYNQTLSPQEINQNYYGGPIITDSLDLVYDASHLTSYESGSLTTYPMIGSITGSLVNGASFSNDGGGSFNFDGTNDVIDLDYTNVMYDTSTMALECWIKSSDTGGGSKDWCTFMGTRYGNSIQIGRYSNTNKCGVLIATSTNGNLNLASGTTPIFDEKWHHCVVTFDNGVCKFYVDANLEVTNSSRSGQTLTTSPSDKFGIGGSSGGGDGRNFYGKITSCKIYSKSLSADEVLQNFNAQKTRFGL